jgi:uncharacterized protein
MLTRRALDQLLKDIADEAKLLDLGISKMILFGSYAKGGVHKYSDVDIAMWGEKFIGEGMIDFELVRPIIRKYREVDIKMYPSNATAEDFDPFIEEIEKTGIVVF